jgi:hypothetical protein
MGKAMERGLDILLAAAEGKRPAAASREAKPSQGLIKIGELASRAGETVPTIRHWAKLGLLAPAAGTASGYALFEPKSLARCSRIRGLQAQRLSLQEIAARLQDEEPA